MWHWAAFRTGSPDSNGEIAMDLAITITFCVIALLIGIGMLAGTIRSFLRWRRASRSLDKTIAKVRREQALLSEGMVPEFASEGNIEDLKRRYLAGEDIPLRWRLPQR